MSGRNDPRKSACIRRMFESHVAAPLVGLSATNLSSFFPGNVDPDGLILTDASHPLVFYEIRPSTNLNFTKASSGQIRMEF
jgi:hypothetical protein